MPPGRSTLRIGSRAAATREPRQVRKEAAISAVRRVPRTGLVRADLLGGHVSVVVDGGCTATSCPLHRRRPAVSTEGRQPGHAHPSGLYRRWRAQTFSQMSSARTRSSRRCATPSAWTAWPTACCSSARAAPARRRRRASWPRRSTASTRSTASRDDTCEPCVAIREGRALDVVELDAASNNRVDDMRELLPRVYTAPADLRRKVFIIDEVQRIKEGWDVLLKTLEEPPRRRPVHLLHHRPVRIRPAVVSRVQRFTFRPLPVDEIEGKLERILSRRATVSRPTPSRSSPSCAAGGMRDAESMLDQVVSSGVEPIDADAVRDLLGLAELESVDRFIDALARGDALDGIRLLDDLEARRPGSRRVRRPGRGAPARTAGRARSSRRAASADVPPRLCAAPRAVSPGSTSTAAAAGGYRLQLELALLERWRRPGSRAPDRRERPADRPSSPPGPRRDARPDAPARPRARAPPGPGPATQPPSGAPRPGTASPSDPRSGRAPPRTAPRSVRREPSTTPGRASCPRGRRSWSASAESRRPAAHQACRPVEVRGATIVLGFPESQAFMRDIAERKRASWRRGSARSWAARSLFAAWRPTSSSSRSRRPTSVGSPATTWWRRHGVYSPTTSARRRPRSTRPTGGGKAWATETWPRWRQQMQAEMARVQEELADADVEGTAGGGAVKASSPASGAGVARRSSPRPSTPMTSRCSRTSSSPRSTMALQPGRARPPSRRWHASPAACACPACAERTWPPLIEPVARLIEAFARLPGIGPKTAQRLTYHLLRAPEARRVRSRRPSSRSATRSCSASPASTSATGPLCPICLDRSRDERPALRRRGAARRAGHRATGAFRGRYHVLHGAISPMDGIGPTACASASCSSGPRGRATASRRRGRPGHQPDARGRGDRDVPRRAPRAARHRSPASPAGIPVGGDLEYADEVTLVRALQGRREFEYRRAMRDLINEILLRRSSPPSRWCLARSSTAAATLLGAPPTIELALLAWLRRRRLHPAGPRKARSRRAIVRLRGRVRQPRPLVWSPQIQVDCLDCPWVTVSQ